MSGIVPKFIETMAPQFLESLKHWPSNYDQPIEGAAAGGLSIFTYIRLRAHYNRTLKEGYAADHPEVDEILKSEEEITGIKRIEDDGAKSDAAGNRKARLGGMALLFSGSALFLGSTFAKPTFDTNRLNSNTNSALVVDETLSMTTRDLGVLNGKSPTRLEAVIKGVNASKYPGKLAIIQVANNTSEVPLASDWRSHTGTLAKPDVNQLSYPQLLVPALQRAEQSLPLAPGSQTKHEGTIQAATDGTFDDQPIALTAEAAQLKADGVKIHFIITGTQGGYYNYHGTKVSSGIETGPLTNAFGASNISLAPTAGEVINDVKTTINGAGNTQQEQPWLPAYVISLGVALAGLYKMIRRTVTIDV